MSYHYDIDKYHLASGTQKYEIISSNDVFNFESTYMIQDTSYDVFGFYCCAVTNSLGSDELSIQLKMQSQCLHIQILL